jgi:hypothetical protein
MKRERFFLLLLILVSVALNILNVPISEIFSDDKEIFKYAGFVIYKGGVPYRDLFDHKPPLIYFLNAFNWYFNAWVPWLLDTFLVLFSTLLFYWLCRKNKLSWPWLLPFIFNLLIRYSLVSFGNGMTREYTAVFLLMFFCVMQGNAKYKFYLMGLLTGLSFWMQQDSLITLAPLLFYSFYSSEESIPAGFRQKILGMGAGFITITIPLILFFISHQSLSYLWEDAFLFNMHAPGAHAGIIEKIKNCKHALHEVEFEMPFYTALILAIASLFLKSRQPLLLRMGILTLLLSFSAELLTGRMKPGNSFVYYLLPLAAAIPILVYIVFTETQASFLQDSRAQLIFSLMLGTTLLLGTLRYASGFRISGNGHAGVPDTPGMDYLKTQSLSDYQLYVFDDSNFIYLYNYFGVLSPSPWIYHYFWDWSSGWDADDRIFNSILADLQSHKTRFILDCTESRNSFKNRTVYADWKKFIETHYTLVAKDDLNRKLWRIQ